MIFRQQSYAYIRCQCGSLWGYFVIPYKVYYIMILSIIIKGCCMGNLLLIGPNVCLSTQITEGKEQCEYLIIMKNVIFIVST